MLDVILVSNYSMKEELEQSLKSNNYKFHDLMIQDINHIERYPIDDEYKTIIIQSANAIKKIDSSNNHIYNAKYIYGIGPNCRSWVQRKFSLDCIIPDHDYSSSGLIEKIKHDKYELGKTLLLKGIGGKTTIQNFLESENLDHNVCNVYERVLNEDNLRSVTAMIKNGAVVIAFSKSSVEPLLDKSDIKLDRVHFIVLDKSDEEIKCDKDVASMTKLVDIYDIPDIVEKIKAKSK